MNPPDAKKRRQMESIEDDESEVSVVNTEFEFPDDILNEEEEDETMVRIYFIFEHAFTIACRTL